MVKSVAHRGWGVDKRVDCPGLWIASPRMPHSGALCLEYTKMKTADHFWTDPSADELVQRHRIHSSHLRQDSPTKRPALCVSRGGLRGPGRELGWVPGLVWRWGTQ